MAVLSITSKDNLLIKKIVHLAKNREYRYQENLAVIYGEHLIIEALRYGVLETLLIDNTEITAYAELINTMQNGTVYAVPREVLRKICILDSLTILVGIIKLQPQLSLETVLSQDCFILDGLQDPGNLGTIMRIAKAAGIQNIVLSPSSVDPYNPKVLRASQGLQFGLSLYTDANLRYFIHNYAGNVIATLPKATTTIYELDLTDVTAWIFGNEGYGIDENLQNLAQIKAQIPMPGGGESLNVAMSAAVCSFEMVRQRLHTA